MRKHPILIFVAVLALLIGSATVYIQSAAFATQLKRVLAKYVPKNLGITADFSNLSIQIFPPGVGVVNPRIEAADRNAANVPGGTKIEAERMELAFRPLQILSGRVSIHEVKIINGKVKTALVAGNAEPRKKRSSGLSWQDLFEIQTERVTLENTDVDLDLPTLKSRAHFNAKSVEIEKVVEKKSTFYDVAVRLGEFAAETPPTFPYPKTLDSLRVTARVGSGGLEIREFELVREGTQAVASGRVTGDVLRGAGLKADLALKLQGDLARMFDFLAKRKETGDEVKDSGKIPQGHVSFDGHAQMELDRVPETLSASGVLKGETLVYRNYRVDRAEIEGSYTAPTTAAEAANEIVVKRAVLESKEIEKKGGRQPGVGGRIEIGAFRYNLTKPAPIETTVGLKRAHLLWLGAELLEDLYSLDGRVSGPTKIRFTPPTPTSSFEVKADVDWDVDGLQIDNQRLGKDKKLNRILHVDKSHLKGTVTVNDQRVRFEEGMVVGMKATQLNASGDIVFGGVPKTTYEITGGGPVDFREFGILAENPIEGVGALGVHVHGPSNAVKLDFDGSMKDFRYLDLAFGEFRGRVTWDDEPSALLFQNLDCNRGRTRYRLNGRMDLGDHEKMDFGVEVPPGGNIGDFVSIFDSFTKNYWWFPRTVTGGMSGKMRVYGGVSLNEMMIDASIDGTRWEYFGERFSRVSLKGGYDKGKYFVSDFDGLKRAGRIHGSISYDAKSNIDWKLATENLTLSDLDRIASLDIPLRGALSGVSQGKGPDGAVESKTDLRLTNLVLRGKKLGDSSLQVETKSGRARVEGSGLGGQATLKALYDFNLGHESFVEAKADGVDFSPMILLLNPALMQDDELLGRISGSYRLDFLSGQAEVGSGQAKVSEYLLRKSGTVFRLDRPYEFRIDRGSFSVPALTLVGDEGSATLSLRSTAGNLSGSIRGRLDLSVAEFFTSAIAKADGVSSLDLAIGGSLKAPRITGSGEVTGGALRIDGIETPIENIDGSYSLSDGTLTLEEFEADLASGRTTMDGTIDFFLTKWPTMKIALGLNGNKLKVYPFQVAKVRGKLDVTGTERPYLVSGKILLENAITREKIANARGPGLRSVQYMPPPSSSSSATIPLFRLDISVSAPGNIIVQNELMDLEAKGELRIVGTIENPRPLGTATAVQGKILFKDRAFQIMNGTMEFDSPATINPRYEVLAVTELANRRIQLFSTGRLDDQRFEFTSNPPMPEPDILNLLALGVTGDDSRKFRANDRSAYEQGEAASLVLHSLDFNREVQNKTGFSIGVDEAVDDQRGLSAFSRATSADSATAPKIVIRRQIGERVGISAGSTVGVGTSIQREVNAEVSVTKGLSVIGVWDSIEGATAEDPKRSSFGVDLKLQKRFK
ncbi:MAG: translocation/assembly module TamB domain-containing protein [Bdellovibrionales bacterium]|nr:translocation/assembly module TamB domain-containing protein [Bdellovibrionales bacterium]